MNFDIQKYRTLHSFICFQRNLINKRISLICLYIYCYVFLFCPLVVYEVYLRKIPLLLNSLHTVDFRELIT